MSGIINAEIYALIFSLSILADYLVRYRYRYSKNSTKFLLIILTIVIISIINIFMTQLADKDIHRFYLMVFTFGLAFIPPFIIYDYIEDNYLDSPYYQKHKKLVTIIYFIFVIIIISIFVFNRLYLESVPLYISESPYYNKLLLISLLPIVVITIEYFITYFIKNRKGNDRLFLVIASCFLGVIVELLTNNISLFTATYIICIFLLYTYKFDTIVARDPLTGLYNREILFTLSHERRHNRDTSVYVIDMDKFKYINDTYGHAKGDKILKDVSTLLTSSIRRNDYVVRYGGDEFIIIANIARKKDVTIIPDKINESIKKYNTNHKVKIGLSIGYYVITSSEANKISFTKAVKLADKMMYEEKEKKKKIS